MKNPRLTSPLSILIAARDRIANVGWVKGQMVKGTSSGEITGFCAVGALGSVSRNFTVKCRACHLLNDSLPSGYYNIVSYNDAKGRRKRDVLQVFDRAIKKLQNLG